MASNSNSDWVYEDFSGANNTDTSNSNNTAANEWKSYPLGTGGNVLWSLPPVLTSPDYDERSDTPDSMPGLEPSFIDNGYILPDPPSSMANTINSSFHQPSRNNKYIEPTRRFNHYEGCLKTDTTNGVYYLNIMDVFAHVTLGSSIADEYYDYINDYICNAVFGYNVDQLDNKLKMTTTKLSFNGRSYERTVVLYHWKHYGIIASSILQWAVCNPEKIAGF